MTGQKAAHRSSAGPAAQVPRTCRYQVDSGYIYTIYTIYTIYCRVRDREDDNDDTVTPRLLTPAVIRHRDSEACLQ